MTPPIAKKLPHELTGHGNTRVDNYYWLRERENPEVTAYLEAENAYTASVMEPVKDLENRIYGEILGRIQQTDIDVPARRDGYLYYSRTEEGKQYRIFCRRKDEEGSPEEVILDENVLAEGQAYFSLGALSVSEDQKWLGYSVDNDGSEEFVIHVKNLATGEVLRDTLPRAVHGLTWANDNRTFFYATFDATKRPEKVWRHTLGTDASQDALVYTEPDPLFTFEIAKTRSRKYVVIISANSGTTSEVSILDADQPKSGFTVFEPRREGIEYYVDHQDGRFLVRTNENAVNFRLMETPVGATPRANWREIIPARPDVTLEEVDAFADFLALHTRENGLPCLNVIDTATGASHAIEFPEPSYTVFLRDNYEYRTSTLRFQYTSQITPPSVYDYDVVSRTRVLLKRTEVLGGYDPEQYAAERLYAPAADGVSIPISLFYKRGFRKDGTGPLVLNGYGAYGINNDPGFSVSSLSLADRGFAVAIAHIRGGSERGRTWFEEGRLLNKRNSFTDFIAAAEHLVKERYTSPGRLAATGGSAGGLLMGAVINMRPDLFRAVVAQVPFVDVLTTMLDPTIPLTTGEYDQWGNPEEKCFYDYIRTYSPYDNIAPTAYPNLLVTSGINDPRVAYWEPAKWVAKLRATKTDRNLLLLKMQMGAGHGGPSGRYERFRETAFVYAFLLLAMDMCDA